MTYSVGYQASPGWTPPPQKKASPALAIVGALVLVASVVVGLLLLTVFGTVANSERIDAFGRFFVEGGTRAEVDIKKTGTYTIYYEYVGELEADRGAETVDAPSDPPDDLEIAVTTEDGDRVRIRDARPPLEFRSGGREGVSVREVEVDAAGMYVVTAAGGEEPYGISIGRGSLDEDLSNGGAKLAGLIVLVAGSLVGVALLLVGLARRRAGRRPQPPSYPSPGQYATAAPGGYNPGPYGPSGPAPGGWGPPPGSQGSPPGWGSPPAQPGRPSPPFPGN